jgi:selenocysteine-specific elongation factor
MNIIVGTAGHIDHGKTALVKALTGTDADRLPEEKRRGITVDLGFAEMSVGAIHFGFVDVPGHERFVKNMLTGASGVDIAMLVIAADEGVMPQTREHFEICRLLGIQNGIVALTKQDLVDVETDNLARLEIAELVQGSFLADAPVVAVSSVTRNGIDDLTHELVRIAGKLKRGSNDLVSRLPIDRSFSVKGFGAVVTGTLASGEISEGQELELMPDGRRLRVRGLQTHGQKVTKAVRGQRVAVNVSGVDHSEIARGMSLTEPGSLKPTQIMDAEIEVLASASRAARTRQRVRVHIGTTEALARIQVLNERGEIEGGNSDFAQIRLEFPIVAIPAEKFIIRSYSPMATVGGGVVIDPLAHRHRRRDLSDIRQNLAALKSADVDHSEKVNILVKGAGINGITLSGLQHRTGLQMNILVEVLHAAVSRGVLAQAGNIYVDQQQILRLSSELINVLTDFHKREPLAKGLSREVIRGSVFVHVPEDVYQTVTSTLSTKGMVILDKDVIRLASHRTELTPSEAALRHSILKRFQEAGLEVPKIDEVLSNLSPSSQKPDESKKILQLLLDSGEILKVTEEFYFSARPVNDLIESLKERAQRSGDRVIDIPKFKEIAGVSRKYAIPLLEYFDRRNITARAGDKRVIL